MKRREVLKAGAVGAATVAVAGAGGAGCATALHGQVADHEAARRTAAGFLATLDAQLGVADRSRAVDGFVSAVHPGPRSPAADEVVTAHDALMRKVMRTLFITQSFRDLPIEAQVQPAVQDRMKTHLDEIDGTVFELSDFLAAQTAAQRTKLRDALRDQPDTAMQIGEQLDAHAAAAGLSSKRRLQLRSMMSQAAFRLRTEAPGALIDEYTAKVTRLRGQDGQSALAIALAEKMGQRAFWKYQHHLAQVAPGGSAATSGPGAAAASSPTPGYIQPVGKQPTQGRGAMRAGGYMMGIGVIVLGVSVALVDASEGFLVGATVGALLIAIGLITLIVGAILYAATS